jgi:hypothetical protein
MVVHLYDLKIYLLLMNDINADEISLLLGKSVDIENLDMNTKECRLCLFHMEKLKGLL